MRREAHPPLIWRLDGQKRRILQRFSIRGVKSTADGAFEARHIGKVDQRRDRLEALQEFRKALAVWIEPSGLRRFACDECIGRGREKILADQSLHGWKIQA